MNLIKSPTLTLSRDLFSLTPEALAQKEAALASSALLGRVSNKAENDAAAAARKGLRTLSSAFEKQRKDLTEPFLEAQRAIMRLVSTERDELDREDARLEELMKGFALEELRLKREAEEAQQRELQILESQKQADIAAASKTGASQEEIIRIEESYSDIIRIESAPVQTTRAHGQTNRKVWKITQINDFQLMKARPDLVRKVEWDIAGIKEALNAGVTLPGVTAEEDLKVGVRGGTQKEIVV